VSRLPPRLAAAVTTHHAETEPHQRSEECHHDRVQPHGPGEVQKEEVTSGKPFDYWLTDMDGVLVHEDVPITGAQEFIDALKGPGDPSSC
jgi:hypothetical protein